MTDEAFDAQFGALAPLDPAPVLIERTLGEVRRERSRGAWRVRAVAATGMLAMAALTLLTLNAPPQSGTAATMVERGVGGASPAIEMKVAVQMKQGETLRCSTDRRYGAGDTLLFRVHAPAAMELALRRNGVALWTGTVPPGESDLPIGYTLEAGEAAAHFTLEGGALPADLYLPAVAP